MSTTRTPAEVLADLNELQATTNTAFVPLNVKRAVALQAELNAATVTAVATLAEGLSKLADRIDGAELFAADHLDKTTGQAEG